VVDTVPPVVVVLPPVEGAVPPVVVLVPPVVVVPPVETIPVPPVVLVVPPVIDACPPVDPGPVSVSVEHAVMAMIGHQIDDNSKKRFMTGSKTCEVGRQASDAPIETGILSDVNSGHCQRQWLEVRKPLQTIRIAARIVHQLFRGGNIC
jgi:hypothetical protein